MDEHSGADLFRLQARIAELEQAALQQKQREKQLRERIAYLERVMDSSLIGIITSDRSGVIYEANRAFLEMVGYSREDMLAGKLSWPAFTPPEYAERDNQAVLELRQTGLATPYEKEFFRRDGSRIPILIGAARLEGTETGAVGFVLDLSRMKQMEAESAQLREQLEVGQNLMAAVIQQMPAGLAIAEAPSGRIILTNEQLERIWHGILPVTNSIKDFKFFDCFHPDTGERYQAEEYPLARAVLKGERIETEEMSVRRADNSSGTFAASAVPILDRNRHIVAGVATFIDITERKQAEENQRFLTEVSGVLSSSLDYATTLKNLTRLAVPRLADWCSIDMAVEENGELKFRHLVLSHPDPLKERLLYELKERLSPHRNDENPIATVMRTGEILHIPVMTAGELSNISTDPAIQAAFQKLELKALLCLPLIARGRTLGVLTLNMGESQRSFNPEDIELAKELARRAALAVDNARLYEQMQQAVKLRDEFLSVAAHELKTPITSLKGFSQLVIRQMKKTGRLDAQRVRLALEAIEQQSDRLAHLVEQLLEVTRLEAGRMVLQPQLTNLRELLENAVALASNTISEQHKLILNCPTNLYAQLDPLRFEQVITNLLSNAVKFSPQGGSILIETQTSADGQKLCLTVTDPGMGIPPERRGYLFERFYQAHPNQYNSGMGLGLYISRQIVELHQGQIEAEFPTEGGTRFIVTIPTGLKGLLAR